MHVQIIRFSLKDATEAEYHALSEELAPTFAEMPGLLTKYWLANPAANIYGGVYIWADLDAMIEFMDGPVAAAVIAHPKLANIKSEDFSVLEAPTRLTRGL